MKKKKEISTLGKRWNNDKMANSLHILKKGDKPALERRGIIIKKKK